MCIQLFPEELRTLETVQCARLAFNRVSTAFVLPKKYSHPLGGSKNISPNQMRHTPHDDSSVLLLKARAKSSRERDAITGIQMTKQASTVTVSYSQRHSPPG